MRIVKEKKIKLIHSHCTQSLIDSSLARLIKPNLKHVHSFHFGNYSKLHNKTYKLENIFCRIPNKLVAVGIQQRESIVKVFRLSKRRIETISNGVEIPDFGFDYKRISFEENIKNNNIILGSISTLFEQKGISYLIDAVSILNKFNVKFELWIVGDGPLRKQLVERTSSLGLDENIKFLGWVKDAAAVILPKIDIFVQSSIWEAMSMAVLEAMAARKPVIVTDVGDNRHVIENGKEGIIVPKKDPEKLAKEIVRLMLKPKLRIELGQKARQKVIAKFSAKIMARNYERLYMDVLGEKY
jgi:glycosyltransferase involved in cell wall biosynthesis